jgi:hypothetical protein
MVCFAFILFVGVLSIAGVLGFPETAYAWGPGAHMVMGNWILHNVALLPPLVADSLARFPDFFLHGCLSADIFIGKGCVAKKGHSHNWESAQALLARAGSSRSRAYAYGYLSHLAADTVAHNVFVPAFFPLAPGNGRIAHVYIEMQADRMLSWDKEHALAVFHGSRSKNAEYMLRKTLQHNAVKFRLQSNAYQASIAVGGSAFWRRSLRAVDRFFPGHINTVCLTDWLETATSAVVDVLRNGDRSPVFTLDPVGTNALANAAAIRSGQRGISVDAPDFVGAVPLPDALQSLPLLYLAKPKVAA